MTSPTPSPRTVSNTSCLIALESIGQLALLHRLYQEVLIPHAVANEWGMPPPPWLKVQEIKDHALAQSLRLQLGPGEAQAITLAIEVGADRLILDDQRARRIATTLNVSLTGTIGVILRAKQVGIIPLVRAIFDDLQKAGLWLADALSKEALRLAGE
ncbi:MAG: DUF3368 domain-containing protein [Gemmataceae bacterium]